MLPMNMAYDPGSSLACKFQAAWQHLDERARRVMAASEAMSMGRGGVSALSRACGLSRNAIHHGINEPRSGGILPAGRVRREGAGRKPMEGKRIYPREKRILITADRGGSNGSRPRLAMHAISRCSITRYSNEAERKIGLLISRLIYANESDLRGDKVDRFIEDIEDAPAEIAIEMSNRYMLSRIVDPVADLMES
jgi:hypothetical protein